MNIDNIIKKTFIFSLAVFLVSLVFSIIVGEFVVKHLIPQKTYKLARMEGLSIFESSPIIPYTLRKNVNRFMHIAYTREFTHFVSTNSQGTRGAEFPVEKPPNTYRILFLGDSITFGWGVEDNQTYPYLVEKFLNQSLKQNTKYNKVEVINAGFTDSNSLDTFYVYYKEIGVKYKPDLVIVDFHPFNDLSDMYYHNWDKVDQNGYPLKISSKTHYVKDGYQISIQKTNWKYEVPILRNTHLGMLLMNAMDSGAPQLVSKIKKMLGVTDDKPVFTSEQDINCVLSLNQRDCPEALWPYVDKAKFMFSGIKKVASDNKEELLLTFMPGPNQVKPLANIEPKLRNLSEVNPQKYYREFFQKSSFQYLDFLPLFLSQQQPMDFFYNQDGHINPGGHQLVARSITAYLQQQKPDLFTDITPSME
ncbi:MAG: SGNH/GDSL hydrolase family protein [Patescibacteria group bacterium]|nr:SGNH/GDSL hydrolase family protein [Patescibacteria group bacterium]